MESMRSTWTDERMDDLNSRVDELSRHMDARFDSVDRRLETLEGRMDRRLDTLQYTMIRIGGGMFATFVVGFIGLLFAHA
jgi:hypothetical protein